MSDKPTHVRIYPDLRDRIDAVRPAVPSREAWIRDRLDEIVTALEAEPQSESEAVTALLAEGRQQQHDERLERRAANAKAVAESPAMARQRKLNEQKARR